MDDRTEYFNLIDRSKWPELTGPWEHEPDFVEWIDSETSMVCRIMRNRFGVWCGYVGVAKAHPLHAVEYGQSAPCLIPLRDAMMNKPMPENPGMALMMAAILGGPIEPTADVVFRVHGGITFAGKHGKRFLFKSTPDAHKDLWWFGFDCGHAGDFTPCHALSFGEEQQYRTMDYAMTEVATLARQIHEVGTTWESNKHTIGVCLN
jgi:hypothetical protein